MRDRTLDIEDRTSKDQPTSPGWFDVGRWMFDVRCASPGSAQRSVRLLVVCLLLALGAGLVYAPAYYHEFVSYDDPSYVTANPHVQAGLTKAGLAWAFGQLHGEHTYWHPLTWLSHMLDCQWFGLKPGPPHLVNAMLHALNAALVFLLLQRMTGAFWRSAAVAALFALHPLQVDTVAWVTERKNVLTTFFALLGMLAYVRYARAPRLSRYWPVVLLFALALMAKPALVALPGLLLVLDFWPLRRAACAQRPAPSPGPTATEPSCPTRTIGQLLGEKIPLAALALVASWLTLRAHQGLGMAQGGHGLTFGLRLENAAVSYARYLGKALWPHDLAVLYPHPGKWPEAAVTGSVLLLLAVTALVAWQTRRRPYLAVGWVWFLGVLAPAIGLVQVGVQAMADRFAYVALAGLFIMVSWGFAELANRWPRREWVCGLTLLGALTACGGVTSRQLTYWRDSLALFEHALQVTRNNYLAHYHVALAWLRVGRAAEAKAHLLEALQLKPDFAPAHYSLGTLLDLSQPQEAIEHYKAAARFNPGWGLPCKALGGVLARLGRVEEATASYASAARLAPDDPETQLQLGVLLASQGRFAEAAAHYREALRLRPDWPETLNNLAWLLATAPPAELRDGAEAVRLAERACALTRRRRTVMVGTLAAAYAEAGRFDDAAQTAQEAITLAQAAGEHELAERNRALRQLYLEHRPFREETR